MERDANPPARKHSVALRIALERHNTHPTLLGTRLAAAPIIQREDRLDSPTGAIADAVLE